MTGRSVRGGVRATQPHRQPLLRAGDYLHAGTEEAELLDNYINLLEIGRTFAAVPGADESTVETLSCMLETVLTDEEVVELLEAEGDTVSYAPARRSRNPSPRP